ncbi:MAG: hypothetical protein BRC32_03300 [Actinobacteria bacterium QS_8_72_14]|nr:MAG: hypothetical protein BRC32_03300 [Actinobacteria bacterium QS_8_72_14]
MSSPDVPAIKRAGLPVDLDRLAREGDEWLSPEERYALKTHGVCAQSQPGVFMIRVRTSDGELDSDTARELAGLADRLSGGWLHLTTRQQAELHHVPARQVPATIDAVADLGLTTRSACGHTVRGIMSCAHADVSLDEPFDCTPDATALAAHVAARGPDIDPHMPQRLNIAFGGCPACREHAKLNDIGFASVRRGDEPGYQVWLGGSLGKSMPTLAFCAFDFVARSDVIAMFEAVRFVFTSLAKFDKPNKARLKFLARELGRERLIEQVATALETARADYPMTPAPVASSEPDYAAALAHQPPGGWRSGVRPAREPGYAVATVNVPLGDVDGDDVRTLADLADAVADGRLRLTRNQNVSLFLPVDAVPALEARLEGLGLSLAGADQARDVRACTGGPVCSLAITPAQKVAHQLLSTPALRRNAQLRVHVSGCQNACAQQQIADLGFSGSKITIHGEGVLGYQVWVGGDLTTDRVGTVIGRVAESDVVAITEADVGRAVVGDVPEIQVVDRFPPVRVEQFRNHTPAGIATWK